jgi:hypothetical protein
VAAAGLGTLAVGWTSIRGPVDTAADAIIDWDPRAADVPELEQPAGASTMALTTRTAPTRLFMVLRRSGMHKTFPARPERPFISRPNTATQT